MRKWEWWLGIGVIVAVILTAAWSVLAAEGMSVSQAAQNVAEDACAEHGGVATVDWVWGGDDYYRADYECREGGGGSEWFECHGCFPVEP